MYRHKARTNHTHKANSGAEALWMILSLHRISMFRQKGLWLGDCFILSLTKLHHIVSTDVIRIRLSGILTRMMYSLMKTGITHVSIRDHRCSTVFSFLLFNQRIQCPCNVWNKSKYWRREMRILHIGSNYHFETRVSSTEELIWPWNFIAIESPWNVGNWKSVKRVIISIIHLHNIQA